MGIGVVAPASGAAPLILVSPHPEEIRVEFEQGFGAWHRARYQEEVRLEWRDVGGSSDAQRFVESEFTRRPAGIGIDLFFGGGPEPFLALAEKRLVEPHRPAAELQAGLPRMANGVEIHDPAGAWHGACLSSFGILQNLRVQQRVGLPRVARWEELARPELSGWVGAGDPRNSGTMNNMFEAFLQAYGWERGWSLLTRIAANVRQFDRFSSTTAKEAAQGQVAYSFCIDYYGFIQIGAVGGGQLVMTLPADFTSVSPDGIAILKGAPHRQTAGRFLDYLLSDAGQALWMLPQGHPEGPRWHTLMRLPVRPELYERHRAVSPIQVNPFTLHAAFKYDAQLARQRRDLVRSLFGALLVDVQPELKRAWAAVVRRGAREAEVEALGRMPLGEAEGQALLAGEWKSAEQRNRRRGQWQAWAREKYRRLSRPAPRSAPLESP